MKKAVTQVRPFLVISLILILLTFSVFGKNTSKEFLFNDTPEYNPLNDDDIQKLYLSTAPINQIYLTRILLKDPSSCHAAFDRVGLIIRKGGLNPAVLNNLEIAQRQLHECFYISPAKIANLLVNNTFENRPFMQARLMLNQAIMNSRIKLNRSFDSEKVLIDKVLKSYFFPGYESSGKIIFPISADFAFEKYMLTEEVLRKQLQLYASDVIKGDVITDKLSIHNLMMKLRDCLVQIMELIEFKDEVISASDETIIDDKSEGMLKSLSSEDKQLALEMITAALKELKIGERKERQVHDALNNAMLLQVIAEPASIGLDPQLRVFAEGVRLELKVSDIGQDEFDIMKTVFESNCKKVSNEYQITLDINCMKDRVSRDSNYNSVQLMVVNASERAYGLDTRASYTIKLVTGLFGEDVEYVRGVLAVLKTYRLNGPFRAAVGRFFSKEGPGMMESLASKEILAVGAENVELWNRGARLYQNFKIVPAKIYISLKKFSAGTYNKIINSLADGIIKRFTIRGRTIDIRHLPKYADEILKSGTLFRTIIGVTILSEMYSLQRDLRMTELKVDKINSTIKYVANSFSLLTYLLPQQIVQTISRSVELGAVFLGWDVTCQLLDNAGYGFLPSTTSIFKSTLSKLAAWSYGKSNLIEVTLDELDEQFKIPLGRFDDDYQKTVEVAEEEGEELSVSQKRVLTHFLATNAAEKLIKVIYFGHRRTNDENGDKYFGKKLNDYQLQYESYRRGYERTLKELALKEHKELINDTDTDTDTDTDIDIDIKPALQGP